MILNLDKFQIIAIDKKKENDHHNRIKIVGNQLISTLIYVKLLKIYERLSFDLQIISICKFAASQI